MSKLKASSVLFRNLKKNGGKVNFQSAISFLYLSFGRTEKAVVSSKGF